MITKVWGSVRGISVAIAIGALAGCAASNSSAGIDAAPTRTVAVTQSAATESSVPNESGNSPATPSQTPNGTSPMSQPPITVDWDSGKGTPEEPALDPSPIGWYEAAFGGPADSQGRTLYVTFDDGPAPATPEVLELLSSYGATATFFVIGKEAANNPNTLGQIQSAGHAIGNHTWSHRDLATLTQAEVATELASTSDVALGAGGCMRPPYGSIDTNSGSVAEDMGLQPIMWTGQAFDWRPPPVDTIVADIKSVTKPGAVILLHDGGGDRTNTVAALRQLLPFWEAEGYTLKPIPACM